MREGVREGERECEKRQEQRTAVRFDCRSFSLLSSREALATSHVVGVSGDGSKSDADNC